uniref:Uncharacterized protein n=1 Tax=Panagrolaimus sp. PS1159 TaxID=55785 RepID=A0AC35FJQ1_9BILA
MPFIYGCFPNPNSNPSGDGRDGTCPTMMTGPMTDPDCDLTVSCNNCPAHPPFDPMNSAGCMPAMFSPCSMNNRIMVDCGPSCMVSVEQSDGTVVMTSMMMIDIICTGSGSYTAAGVTDVERIRCNP